MLDLDEEPLRATARPEGYFLHLGDETRVLAWWANIFVAIGLTFTFLGIVAALLKAVQAMGTTADPANMQAALVGLLHITAAKLWTSIGGVLASIILCMFDRHWHSRTQRRLEMLCDRIEAGTKPALPQLPVAEQLAEARRQTELMARRREPGRAAGASGEAGGERIAEAARLFATVSERLAATLGSLETRVGGVVQQASAGIDETVGRAVQRTAQAAESQADTLTAASDEVRGLLATLAKVAGEMGGVFAAVRGTAQGIERSVAATHGMLDSARQTAARSEETTRALVAGMAETTRARSASASVPRRAPQGSAPPRQPPQAVRAVHHSGLKPAPAPFV